MGLRNAIFALIGLFLIVNFVSAGRVLAFLLPEADAVLGSIFCYLAGTLVNPVADLGFIKISYPVINDLAIVGIPAFVLAFLILRWKKEWHNYKHIILVYLTVFGILFLVEKALGLWFLFVAENSYGLKGCADYMNVAGQQIPYNVMNPLFILGLIFLVVGIIAAVIKLKLLSNKNRIVSV